MTEMDLRGATSSTTRKSVLHHPDESCVLVGYRHESKCVLCLHILQLLNRMRLWIKVYYFMFVGIRWHSNRSSIFKSQMRYCVDPGVLNVVVGI
jgi:hypothetical protein